MQENIKNIFFQYLEETNNLNSCADIIRFIANNKKVIKLDALNNNKLLDKLIKCELKIEIGYMNKINRYETWNDLIPISNFDNKKYFHKDVYEFWIIGNDSKIVKDTLHAELYDPEKAGYMLGYPNCCVKKWNNLEINKYWTLYLLSLNKSKNSYPFQNNRILTEVGFLSLLGEMFPCSLDCKKSKEIGNNTIKSLKNLKLTNLLQNFKNNCLKTLYFSENGEISLNYSEYSLEVNFYD